MSIAHLPLPPHTWRLPVACDTVATAVVSDSPRGLALEFVADDYAPFLQSGGSVQLPLMLFFPSFSIIISIIISTLAPPAIPQGTPLIIVVTSSTFSDCASVLCVTDPRPTYASSAASTPLSPAGPPQMPFSSSLGRVAPAALVTYVTELNLCSLA